MNDTPLVANYPYVLHDIELTNHCPMSCVMCPRRNMKRELGFMDINLFKSIIDQFKADNHIYFETRCGFTCLHHTGESLLHPNFDEAISYAQANGLDICLSFNPLVLTLHFSTT